MEKALFPLKYMRVTQGVNGEYSHKGTFAIDFGNRGGREDLYAPFTGTIKKVYTHSGNFVWLESNEKVLWADGTVDYMTVLTGHDNDVSDLYVGKVVNQGEVYYQQGNAGNATGVHTHLEVGRGKFSGSGWFQNNYDIWMVNNAVHPVNALFLPDDVVVEKDGGYNWKRSLVTPVSRDTSRDQIEVLISNLRCRKSPNGEILGFITPGIYNIISHEANGDYEWYQVENERFIAYHSDWANLYEIVKEEPVEADTELLKLQKENAELKAEIESLKTQTNLQPIFECQKDDLYAVRLYEGETVYIEKKGA